MALADAAREELQLAEAHERAARGHRQRAACDVVGDSGEQAVMRVLEARGWGYLHHRQRRSTRNGDIDFLVVSCGGVFVLDAKAWREPYLENGRLFRGQEDCTESLEMVLDQAVEVEQVLGELGLAPLEVHPALVFTRCEMRTKHVGRVLLAGLSDLGRLIDAYGCRLSGESTDEVLAHIELAFPPYRERRAPAVAVARPRPAPRPEQLSAFDVAEIDLAELSRAAKLP